MCVDDPKRWSSSYHVTSWQKPSDSHYYKVVIIMNALKKKMYSSLFAHCNHVQATDAWMNVYTIRMRLHRANIGTINCSRVSLLSFLIQYFWWHHQKCFVLPLKAVVESSVLKVSNTLMRVGVCVLITRKGIRNAFCLKIGHNPQDKKTKAKTRVPNETKPIVKLSCLMQWWLYL